MHSELQKGRVPVKLWCEKIEAGALEQITNLSNHPHTFHHVAIMPDCHEGYGMPIGGVLATEGVIIPNAVGVDIGCGMCAVKTSVERLGRKHVEAVLDAIRRMVPVGFNHHKHMQEEKWMPPLEEAMPIVEREYKSARSQVGTLGGGNHFIEIQSGSDGLIWLMIHSGSRNIGLKVAEHYNKVAATENEKRGERLPKAWQLDFLRLHSEEGQRYLREMNYCVDFALNNRRLMMERIKEAFVEYSGRQNIGFMPIINIAHNYAELETHFGKKVMLHRKGATKAEPGLTGIIPGSQGSKSYIVEGLGNPDSFNSCSHGAGRKMGRREAVKRLKFDDELYKLEKQGIVHSLFRKADLEEAMGAYKDISEVMAAQTDLVKILVELAPLGVIKG